MRHVVLVAVLVVGCGEKDRGGGAVGGGREVPQTAKIEGTVSGGMLWLDYTENAALAHSKYQDKTLLVKAQVHSVAEGGGGYVLNCLVYLDESNKKPPATVAKFSAAHRDRLAKLMPGHEIWIVGRCAGKKSTPAGRNGVVVVLESCRPATDTEQATVKK